MSRLNLKGCKKMRTTDFEEIIGIHNNLINSGKVQDFEDALEKKSYII